MTDTRCPCGYTCIVQTIDGMVATGKLAFNAETEQIVCGSSTHRPRSTLLRQPGYAKLRQRIVATLHPQPSHQGDQ